MLPEADSDRALAVRAEFQNRIHQLIAPDFCPAEVAHSLTRAERKQILSPGDADLLLADILTTPPRLIPHLPLLKRAVAISSQTLQGLYDCLYIALAESEGCELLTSDHKLVTRLGPAFPLIRPLASLP